MDGLVQKREELKAKADVLAKVFEEAKTSNPNVLDLKKVKSIDGDEAFKRTEIKRMNDEMTELGQEIDVLAAQKANDIRSKALNEPAGILPMPGVNGAYKSLGERFVTGEWYKGRKTQTNVEHGEDMEVKDIIQSFGLKATMTTAAGWAPQAIRTDIVIPAALRPVQVLDLIPAGETTQAAVVFMEETTATSGAVEVSEGSAYTQSAEVFTQRTSNVSKIGTFLPVTDEQLDDVPMVQGFVDGRMVFYLRQRLDGQAILGNGTPPNLQGLDTLSGIQSQARGTDPGPDALYKAYVNVLLVGRAYANAYVMHPTDWQNIRLLRTAEGVYIWGSPSDAGPARMWGLPVAQSDAKAAGTAYCGDFQNFSGLFIRRGIEVQVGYNNDDFTKGLKSIRADLRVALVFFRPAAFCKVTGL